MEKEIRILMLEDNPADAMLIHHELRAGRVAFRAKRVSTKESFLFELHHNAPDLILSDHGLPTFDGFSALAIARHECPDTPFIFVTGSLGGEKAIEVLKAGATDCVLKEQLHTNLVRSIQRALLEAQERRNRRLMYEGLRASEERLRLLLEGVKDTAMTLLDAKGIVQYWNSGAERIFGYTSHEMLGQNFSCLYPVEAVAADQPQYALYMAWSEDRYEEESARQRKGGSSFLAQVVLYALRDGEGKLRGYSHVARDLTEPDPRGQPWAASDAESKQLLDAVPDAVLVLKDGEILFGNQSASQLLGLASPKQLVGKALKALVPAASLPEVRDHLRQVRLEQPAALRQASPAAEKLKTAPCFCQTQLLRSDGSAIDVLLGAAPLAFLGSAAALLFAYELAPP